MINHIEIHNFMSHKETHMFFSRGVNVIIGPSDHGKSAIMRAITWLITNRPLGDAYKRFDTKTTSVELSTSDDNTISRVKGKTTNSYFLNNTELTAFAQQVPNEVTESLRIKPINIQGQIDPHFMLSWSPGDVAAHLNDIAQLSKIDIGMRNLTSGKIKASKLVTSKENELEDIKNELKQYKDLDTIDGRLNVLEDLQSEIINQIQKKRAYKVVLERMLSLQRTIRQGSWAKKAEKRVSKLQKINLEIEQQYGAKHALETELSEIVKVKKMIGMKEQLVLDKEKGLKELQRKFKKLMPNSCPLCGGKV